MWWLEALYWKHNKSSSNTEVVFALHTTVSAVHIPPRGAAACRANGPGNGQFVFHATTMAFKLLRWPLENGPGQSRVWDTLEIVVALNNSRQARVFKMEVCFILLFEDWYLGLSLLCLKRQRKKKIKKLKKKIKKRLKFCITDIGTFLKTEEW